MGGQPMISRERPRAGRPCHDLKPPPGERSLRTFERGFVTTQLLEPTHVSSTRPHAADDAEAAQLARTWRRPPGFYGWLTSTHHKDIGLRFIVTAFINFGLAGLL